MMPKMQKRNLKTTLRAQTAIEYLLLLGAAVVFVTIVAYLVKNAVGGG